MDDEMDRARWIDRHRRTDHPTTIIRDGAELCISRVCHPEAGHAETDAGTSFRRPKDL
jgi:hypothetical protein